MPAREDMPGTLKRSPKKAQDTYAETHDSAVQEYGEGERAHRTAFAAVKHSFEKVGDHWEPKEKRGPSDAKATGGRDTKAETAGGVDANASKQHLMELAKRLEISGRSKMTKPELVDAIQKANGSQYPQSKLPMTPRQTVAALLDQQGHTFAEEAGIKLADKPGPLYQLLVLATLLSARISASVAVAAARELFAAGYRTPRAMLDASWQDRVDALGRGHYRRYDERTATMLGDGARLCRDRWTGDLRRLHADPAPDHDLLTEFPGIGPVGADIFLREVQGVWPEVAPFLDRKVADGAQRLHLPSAPADLAALTEARELPRLAAALVRVARDRKAADAVLAAS